MSEIQKKIKEAEERMRDAKQKLEKAQREGAIEDEKKAQELLNEIQAELERLLQQLREEELARMLAYLEARFKKMLEMQVEVYEGTLHLDNTLLTLSEPSRTEVVQAGRLSRKESAILLEAEKAMNLLREEGSSVAMPEAVGQMMEDMDQVVVRLSQTNVGEITQGIEVDIIAALEEMIAALQKAQQELEQQQQPPSDSPPGDQPLIDQLAELKMLRSLQLRVNKRTQRYANYVENATEDEAGQAMEADLIDLLKKLSERESRILGATRDIVTGKNQ